MLTKLLAVTTEADWDSIAHEFIDSAASPSSGIISTVISVLSLIAFVAELAIIALIIYKSRKFKESKLKADYELIPKLAKTLEVITIMFAIRVVGLIINIPLSLSAIGSIDTVKGLWGAFEEFPPQLVEALERATDDLKNDLIMSNVTNIAFIVGLFLLALYAWHCYQEAKKLYAYLFPLGGVHMNPHAPINPRNAVLPTDDELFGGTGSSALQGGGDEAKMKELFGEEQTESKSVSVPVKKELNKPQSDEDIFGSTDSSLFAGGEEKEEEMKLFKKKEPAREVIKTETPKQNDDIFGSSSGSAFMQRDDDELEKMRSLLLDDSPAAEAAAAKTDDDIFGSAGTSSWGMVADENDPLLSQLLVDDEKTAPAEELGGGDIFGSDNTSAWGSVADDSLLEGVIVKDEVKEKEELHTSDDVFGSGSETGWGAIADENDPLLNKLVASDEKKEEKYGSADMFGEGSSSGWGNTADENDPLFKSLIDD